jgi:hypothetical protein
MTNGVMSSVRTSAIIAIALLNLGAFALGAQTRPDSARCDSILASAAVDSVSTAVFLSVEQIDADWMGLDRLEMIESSIASYFHAPRPFHLSVFAGPSIARGLRISVPGDSGVPREPSVIGTYRVDVTDARTISNPEVVRASLLRGFDDAIIAAARSAAFLGGSLRLGSGDWARLQIRVSMDSLAGAVRLAQGTFPRMRVRDASPLTRTRPEFPSEARADSLDHGEAVLRFVVDRDGRAAFETVEIVRASALPFARAALVALGKQNFNPATIRGCPVAQLVEFPFFFDTDERPPADGSRPH